LNGGASELTALHDLSESRASLEVRAQPGAKQSAVAGTWNGKLKIAVRAPAEDGRANAEIVRVLASALGLARSGVELVRGEHARIKVFHIALSADEARRRLREHLPPE
jgi:uncharacterized protein (TIGR00251 family)